LKNGIEIYDINNFEEKWIGNNIIYFDPKKPYDLTTSTWLKPLKWNQGGYDAVYIEIIDNDIYKKEDKKINVKFVQITRGKDHSLKLQYFKELMENLKELFETITLDIYFIVPFDNIRIFKISESKVESQGSLGLFGWEKYKEKEKVKIFGIKELFK
jgi:hypothetical protein